MREINLKELEKSAKACLPSKYYDYFCGGADDERGLHANIAAFGKLSLWPRVLRGGFDNDLAVEIAGCQLSHPIIVAPTAFHKLAHPAGEAATAIGAAKADSIMIVSMAATTAIETIVNSGTENAQNFQCWFQLYVQPDKSNTLNLIRRVEDAGCKALVITVDSPLLGNRERDKRNAFSVLPDGMVCEHIRDDNGEVNDIAFVPELGWEDIAWLRRNTALPLVLKGILHPHDLEIAIETGVNAIIVSNHGGRQLDSAPATIEVLPYLKQVGKGRVPLIVDGGIRRGSDIVKAMSLGASAVAVGRPIIWGLATNGGQGVYEVIEMLKEELFSTLSLCGCRNKNDINPELIFQSGA